MASASAMQECGGVRPGWVDICMERERERARETEREREREGGM